MTSVKQLQVNGTTVGVDADPARSLLSVLRDDLDLTGSKFGCGEGECGACTVLLDGRPIRSCQTPVGSVGARKITTIESLEQDGRLHPLQEAFLEIGSLQCGYCTSGMIMSGLGLLRRNPQPTEAEIIRFMNGNVCRCGTYRRIIAAIQVAATQLKEAAQ